MFTATPWRERSLSTGSKGGRPYVVNVVSVVPIQSEIALRTGFYPDAKNDKYNQRHVAPGMDRLRGVFSSDRLRQPRFMIPFGLRTPSL